MDFWHARTAEIDAARNGGEEALNALLALAWPHAYRIALSIVRHPMSAEDAAQEACARVMRAITDLRSSEAFGVWFYRLVVREALAIDRRRRRHEPLDAIELRSASPLSDAVVRLDVLRALGTLPPRERAVVALHYYAELNSREIGAVLQIPDGTIRYLLGRARKRLEHALDAHRPFTVQGVAIVSR